MPLLDGCVANQMVTAKEQLTPSQRLSAQAWLTTAAKDQNTQNVALTDARAKNFVGYAYFKNDGTFKMYNLDDTPKMQGTWSVSEDGKNPYHYCDECGRESVIYPCRRYCDSKCKRIYLPC
ncbi:MULTISPECIES: DUF4822 domain-containing protein [Acinetobacter]|uniref:DUF4822 domain-containing protein n=1 Tax=Acinetobacter sp. YH12210 TaxID=2601146 RepID=UPI001C550CA2|nr:MULTISPECIES: DUF4822 domain-containing protein [Acinetobacter]